MLFQGKRISPAGYWCYCRQHCWPTPPPQASSIPLEASPDLGWMENGWRAFIQVVNSNNGEKFPPNGSWGLARWTDRERSLVPSYRCPIRVGVHAYFHYASNTGTGLCFPFMNNPLIQLVFLTSGRSFSLISSSPNRLNLHHFEDNSVFLMLKIINISFQVSLLLGKNLNSD